MANQPNIGKQLAEVPIATMIENLAIGIARAQNQLDINSVKTLQQFNKTKITINKQQKTLLECGLLPSFYFFSEASIEMRMSMSMRSEDTTTVSAGVNAEMNSGSVSVGANLNFENTRKFEFSAEGSTMVSVRLVTLPPPAQLLAMLGP